MKEFAIIHKSKRNNKVHLRAISKQLKAKEDAYNTGKEVAKKWINNASSREIIDVLPRLNLHHDMNYFALIKKNLFISIEKNNPAETKRFKWFNNFEFMKGWREEVIFNWKLNE